MTQALSWHRNWGVGRRMNMLAVSALESWPCHLLAASLCQRVPTLCSASIYKLG